MARYLFLLLLLAALASSGCAAGMAGSMAASTATLELLADATSTAQPAEPAEPEGGFVTVGDDEVSASDQVEEADRYVATSATRHADDQRPTVVRMVADRIESGRVQLAQQPLPPRVVEEEYFDASGPEGVEEIVTPRPVPPSRFRPGRPEEETDRLDRQIVDVPVDIRPTEGLMPEDMAAKEFAGQPTIDETFPSDMPADIFCSYTPWTICYRPLYFEDIALERYGCNVGYLQTGLSGVRFFSSVAALPYKMTRRPPRSCQCSNGFSRCGDCPLPCYGVRKFEWDAALMEAAAITAFAFIIP